MKKLLRPLFILLLLALGFLYIVKNPDLPISQNILTTLGIDMSTDEGTGVDLTNCLNYFDGCNTCMVSGGVIGGCTKMFCQEPAEPQCLEYIWTGMDLSGCVSYFDGCNNCTVENGRPSACTEMYCETPAEPKCNEYVSESEMTGNSEFSYSQQEDIAVTKTNPKFTLSSIFNAAERVQDRKDCEINTSLQYFTDLLSKFDSDIISEYTFTYTNKKPTQADIDLNGTTEEGRKIYILPNRAGYTTNEQFIEDFGTCGVAGIIPLLVGKKYILFIDGCGSGAGEPFGCTEINNKIQDTIQLK